MHRTLRVRFPTHYAQSALASAPVVDDGSDLPGFAECLYSPRSVGTNTCDPRDGPAASVVVFGVDLTHAAAAMKQPLDRHRRARTGPVSRHTVHEQCPSMLGKTPSASRSEVNDMTQRAPNQVDATAMTFNCQLFTAAAERPVRSCRLRKTGGEAQQALDSPASSDDCAAGHMPCQMSAKPQVTSGNSMGMLPAADGMVAPTCAPPAQGRQQPQNMPAGSPADADAQPGSQRLDAAAAPAAGVLPVTQLQQDSRAEPTAKRTKLQQQTAPTTRTPATPTPEHSSATATAALASKTAAATPAAAAAVPAGMASGGLAQVPLVMHVSLPVEAPARPEPSAVAANVQPHRPSTPVQLPQLSPRRQSVRNHEQKAAAAEAKLQQLERRLQKPAAAKARLQHTPLSGSPDQHSSAAHTVPAVREAARPATTLRQVSPPAAAAATRPTGASKAPPATPAAQGKSRPGDQAVRKAIANATTLDQLPSRPTTEHLRVIYYQKRKQLLQEAVAAGPAAVSAKPVRKRSAGAASTPPSAAAPAGVHDGRATLAAPRPAPAARPRLHVRDPVVAKLTDEEQKTLAAAKPAVAKRLRSADKAAGGVSTPAQAQAVPPKSLAAAAETAATPPSPSALPAVAVRTKPASRRHAQSQGAAPASPTAAAAPSADAKRSPASRGVAAPQPKRYGTRAATPRRKTLAATQPQPAVQVVISAPCWCMTSAETAEMLALLSTLHHHTPYACHFAGRYASGSVSWKGGRGPSTAGQRRAPQRSPAHR
jgi:hypothetical protein